MPRVLVIDDDKLVRDAACILLNSKGYMVETAADGASGIGLAKSGQFDAAIVDLFMTGMDGLAVMRAIRAAKPTLPMIAASGFMFKDACPQMPEFEALAVEAGASATLYKPFRPHDVFCALDRVIGNCGGAAY